MMKFKKESKEVLKIETIINTITIIETIGLIIDEANLIIMKAETSMRVTTKDLKDDND